MDPINVPNGQSGELVATMGPTGQELIHQDDESGVVGWFRLNEMRQSPFFK